MTSQCVTLKVSVPNRVALMRVSLKTKGLKTFKTGQRLAMFEFRKAQEEGTKQIKNALFIKTTDFARPAELSPCPGHGHHWFANAESYLRWGPPARFSQKLPIPPRIIPRSAESRQHPNNESKRPSCRASARRGCPHESGLLGPVQLRSHTLK
jgi:hypothetical protein